MNKKLLKAIAFIAIVAGSYAVGLISGVKHLFPTDVIIGSVEDAERYVQESLLDKREYVRWEYQRHIGELQWVENLHPDALKTNPNAIIHAHTPSDVKTMRARLQRYIWKSSGLPKDRLPDSISLDISDERYASLGDLKRIDRYIVKMEFGINSIVYHFHPVDPNGKAVIYHQGHRGDFILGIETISALLDAGYSVLGFAMPFKGMNSAPDIYSPQFGFIKNFGHNTFYLLESEELAPIKFFLEPMTAVANFVEREYDFGCLGMVGISGGGWMTILYSATDERICKSYPVAGKLPMFLLALPPNDRNTNNRADKVVGDYEEFIPELNQIANFLDLSILGASGEGRRQLQVINEYDNLTYRGIAARYYEDAVSSVVESMESGSFKIFIDDTHTRHEISPAARSVILDDLRAE